MPGRALLSAVPGAVPRLSRPPAALAAVRHHVDQALALGALGAAAQSNAAAAARQLHRLQCLGHLVVATVLGTGAVAGRWSGRK